jgi:hypothetical protein
MDTIVEKPGLKVDTIRLIDLTGGSYYLTLEECPTWFVRSVSPRVIRVKSLTT